MNTKRKHAFTLIELLVVIAIIALLLAILVPSLNKVKKQTRRVICATNLHQWGLAVTVYGADNGNRFPNNGYDSVRDSLDFHWVTATMTDEFFPRYLYKSLDDRSGKKRNNILFCPDEKYHRSHYTPAQMQYFIDNGLVGYTILFGNDAGLLNSRSGWKDYAPPTCPRGLDWVTRKKLGGEHSRGPVMSCVLQSLTTQFLWDDNGVPLSSNASPRDNIPEGGYFLFEDVSASWYKGVDTGTEKFHGGQIRIGALQGNWQLYYGLAGI